MKRKQLVAKICSRNVAWLIKISAEQWHLDIWLQQKHILTFTFSSPSSIQTESGLKSTPKILDDIFASLVQSRTLTDLPKKPQGLTIKPTILGFDTPHYWLCDNRLLCLQDPNNASNWNVFRECWKQGQVFSSRCFVCFLHTHIILSGLIQTL